MRQDVKDEVRTASPRRLRLMPLPSFGALSRARRADVAPRPAAPVGQIYRAPRRRRSGLIGLALSFLLFVGVPVATAGAYYGFVASDIFVSQAKFAVRGAVEHLPQSPALAMFSPLTAMNSNQDAYIVASYIESQPLIEKVAGEHDLRRIFGANGIDPYARLKSDASAEDLQAYWNHMVRASIDNVSGVVTLQVKAFTPGDALAISQTILKESENLVNEMSRRKNADAVRFAREDVARAEKRLQTARLAMQDFRNQSGLIDPVRQADATLRLGMALRSERISLENELNAARRTLSENAPSVQVLSARLAGIKDQMGALERSLTGGPGPSGQTPASAALSRYEGLELERLFSEKLYAMAQTIYEKVRITADRQGLYLATFVQPVLAQIATFPQRGTNILVVLACAFAVWSILVLVTASVRDHNL